MQVSDRTVKKNPYLMPDLWADFTQQDVNLLNVDCDDDLIHGDTVAFQLPKPTSPLTSYRFAPGLSYTPS